eukprot:gb/GFBE01014019.1/.p1 GENE.gb/GFBE01014019.1/~~gb/GFBE01014019.1/.p1  ORF type:complete len:271 (+),score=50.59 gb/GFBE01014019.1/:1-813(+)
MASIATESGAKRRRHGSSRLLACSVIGLALTLVSFDVAAVPPPSSAGLRRHLLQLVGLGSCASAGPSWAGDWRNYRDPEEVATEKLQTDAYGNEILGVVRPREGRRLYSFGLPVPEGKFWGDASNDDVKETDLVFKGKFGNQSDRLETTVIAGKLPSEFVTRIREANYTQGCGIISDRTSGNAVDLEWTDVTKVRGKKIKWHNYARVLYADGPPAKVVAIDTNNTNSTPISKKKVKDVLLSMRIPESQLAELPPLWPTLRDTLQLASGSR